jgi:hypothetical protein
VHAVEQQHGMFSYDDVHPQHQHQQQIRPPEWHPRLFGLQDSKRDALEHSARLYYDEVWGAGSVDLLDELTTAGVCFNDALGMEADAFSRASLKAIISEFQASHPLLKYEVVSHNPLYSCKQGHGVFVHMVVPFTCQLSVGTSFCFALGVQRGTACPAIACAPFRGCLAETSLKL